MTGLKDLTKSDRELVVCFSKMIKKDAFSAIRLLDEHEKTLSHKAKTHIAALSVRGGLIEIFKDFEAFIDINSYKYYDSHNLLLNDAIGSRSEELVQYLINRGADLKTSNPRGNPILFKAVYTNDLKIWDILSNHNIDINTTNKAGTNLLTFAIRGINVNSAIYLLRKGGVFQYNKLSLDKIINFNLSFIEYLSNKIETVETVHTPWKLYFDLRYFDAIKDRFPEQINIGSYIKLKNRIEFFKTFNFNKIYLQNKNWFNIEDKTKESLYSALPPEIWVKIFGEMNSYKNDINLLKNIEAYRLDNFIECIGQFLIHYETPESQ
ncbi:MAG: Ankyrin repeat (3 copies) [Rickettsiaceae bacterium]|jgi:hypothetical protein|nr:Ankyrin repeat (3 copies) [Rickettsiaceae bacterium]